MQYDKNIVGTYAKLVPDTFTSQKVAAMINLLNVENGISVRDLHVTVIHSQTECAAIANLKSSVSIKAKGKSFDIYPNPDGTRCLILHLDSDDMHNLHDACRAEGAMHDYPTYNSHLTLSYDYTSKEVPSEHWLDYFTHLVFDQFVVEPLCTDWKPNETNI